MKSKYKTGLLFAALAAGISGISIFYNKLVVVSGIDPLIFNILKNGGVAIVLTVLLIATGKHKLFTTLTPKSWAKLLFIGLIGGSIPFILFFDALRAVPAINANIIQKSLFIWVALLALPILNERLTWVQIAGYLIVAASNLVIGGFTGLTGSRYEFMILTATLLWALENILAKIVLKDLPSLQVAWARMFFGTIFLLLFSLYQTKTHLLFSIQPSQLLAVSGSILLLTGYVMSWYGALRLAPATLVASVLILATPVTNMLSAVFITHQFPETQLLNLAGTLIGLTLISRLFRNNTPDKQATL